jgi:hypothetical protein
VETPYIRGEEEEFQSNLVVEDPLNHTQAKSCVGSTTLCVSPQSKITIKYFSKSIVVIQGGQSSSSSQNSGSSAQSQNHNQIQSTSPRGGTTQRNMVGVDNTLIIHEF